MVKLGRLPVTRGARRLGLLFLAVIVPTAVTLIWLGLRLLDQDRTLWTQRELERRQQEAAEAARLLRDRLDASLDAPLPHSVRFRLGPRSMTPDDPRSVLWLPVVAGQPPDSSAQFSELDIREFRGQAADALVQYLELAQSPNRATAAAALMRAARVYRARREWDEALAVYRRMAPFGDTWLNEMPADLLARRASCEVLEEAGRKAELAIAAEALAKDFKAGVWKMDRTSWELTRKDIETWTARSFIVSEDERALTAAADALWSEWTD